MATFSLVLGVLAADAVPSGFAPPEPVYGQDTPLVYPTNLEFAANGRVFITEKRGTIQTAASIGAPLTQFADLRAQTHDFWDRGMLGLAIHPQFPSQPYVYVLYAYGTPLPLQGGPTQTYGDGCPTPPGGTADGCVVSARLSRLTAAGPSFNQMVPGSEAVLITDWCQQFPSHSIGDLEFGVDGALYASGGDGASFQVVDYGQLGGTLQDTPTPINPCGDPPSPPGGPMSPPTAEGGALRAQDLRTSADPVSLNGAVIRIDPMTGAAFSGNPNAGLADLNGRRVVAYGLRNPYRFAIKPGTNQLFIGDVGLGTWEEVNHHPDPTSTVRNFGWPCYEGGNGNSLRQSGYDGANLSICETLYNAPGSPVSPALFAYRHNEDISGSDDCPPAVPGPTSATSSSITGVAFYPGGNYPGVFNGALFGADYSRHCIWVMYPNQSGNPDPTSVEVFHYGPPPGGGQQGISPVDLEMGPDGNMYYISYLQGVVGRFRYTGGNTPPVAVIAANPTSGPAPLQVQLSGAGSSDPDGHPLVEYAWDLDNDGQFDDAFGEVVAWTFSTPGPHTARLRVTDFPGETGTASIQIQVSNSPPVPEINTPTAGTQWAVGDTINFSGRATDPEEGALPASRLDWLLIMHHCEGDGSCHEHHIQTFIGKASGSFTAPDHEYPSHLELRLTARDQFGVTATASRVINPKTVQLTFASNPSGVGLSYSSQTRTAPFTETAIVGSQISISAPATHLVPGQPEWVFASWSNGGARSQTITAPAGSTTYTAHFAQVLGPNEGDSFGVVDSTTGVWYLRNPANGQTTSFYYGHPGDFPFMGDWNCDGIDTPGLYRQSDGFVYLRNTNTQGVANISFFFGNAGDIPVAGDFNGDGCDTVSIYRPSEARFYIINKLGANGGGLGAAEFSYLFGNVGDKPFAGDFNGNGIDTMGLHRESTGLVYFRNSHTQGVADKAFIFGDPGDRIITGRWAQIGVAGPDTVGLFRPSNGTIYLKFTNTQGVADLSFKYGNSAMWPVAGFFGNLPGGSPPPPG